MYFRIFSIDAATTYQCPRDIVVIISLIEEHILPVRMGAHSAIEVIGTVHSYPMLLTYLDAFRS